jgi:ankyrin repeat protein
MSHHKSGPLLLVLCALTAGVAAAAPRAAAPNLPDTALLQLRTKQFQAAAATLRNAARSGDVRSEYLLGLMYASGVGVARSTTDARSWLKRAAEKSDADAALALAGLLASGTAQERAEASTWLARAAKEGKVVAQHLVKLSALPLAPVRALRDARLAPELAGWAVRRGDEMTLRAVMTLPGALKADSFGRSLLHEAALAGSRTMVSLLLTSGLKAEPDHFGTTPLMLAAQAEQPGAVAVLLQQAGAVHLRDRSGNDALMYAARSGRVAQLRQLLAAGAEVNGANADDATALDVAMLAGHQEAAQVLREAHGTSHMNNTALLPQAHTLDTARPGEMYQGWPPLAIAASRDDPGTVTQLLATHAAVDQRTPRGDTALLVAAKSQAAKVVPLLLQGGASAGAVDEGGHTALSYAAEHGEVAVVDALLAGGVSADLRRRDALPPLLEAATGGQREVVQHLLSAHANVNARGRGGITALMIAAARDDASVVAALLAGEADVRAKDDAGHMPLYYAAAGGHLRALDALLQAGSPPDGSPEDSPLLAAVRGGHLEIVQHLLARGASVRTRTASGDTPLMLAAAVGNAQIVQELLKTGAEVDVQNSAGDSALIVAARNGRAEVCRVLLQGGADRRLRNGYRIDALDTARRRNLSDLVTLLQGTN